MRRHPAFIALALGLVATSAFAHDATRVLYDLSELQGQSIDSPSSSGASGNGSTYDLPLANLPISKPSTSRSSEGLDLVSSDDLELLGDSRRGGHGIRNPAEAPRGRAPGGEAAANPTPNPEPGTMLLLGSALAAGARYVRRRRT